MLKECISCGKMFETENKDDNLCLDCLDYFSKEDEEYRKMKSEIEKILYPSFEDYFEGLANE